MHYSPRPKFIREAANAFVADTIGTWDIAAMQKIRQGRFHGPLSKGIYKLVYGVLVGLELRITLTT